MLASYLWDRPGYAAVAILVPLRLWAASTGVADCDESFNYWEAVHLFAAHDSYRRPLQTWEYAPNYALRSWAYVLPFAGLARLASYGAKG